MPRFAFLSICLFAAFVSNVAAAKIDKPNVVLILLDNCGQEWFGCYGSDERRTPNIDALARGGVRFEHCYTFPVCGPSRIELLTGRYPFHTGFRMHHDAALYSGGGLDPQREVALARPFQDAGYATAIAGKWQVNNLYDEHDVLKQHGFDEQLVWPGSINRDRISADDWSRFQSAIVARDADTLSSLNRFIESRYWDPVLLRNGKREVAAGKFGPDVFQEFAIEFIRHHRDKPFFLYYPIVLMHGQNFNEHVVATPNNRGTERSEHEMFGDMVEYADGLVGTLVATLDELKLRDRTLVIVATDNGSEPSLVASRNGRPARGGLYQLTEAGSDVVLIANCPGEIPDGRTVALADFTDIYPTVCDFAGVARPQGVVLDGHSHAAILRGDSQSPPRQWIYNQFDKRRVVRDERYKLYSTGEFFDVATDREEQHDLTSSANPQAMAARKKLEAVLASLPEDVDPPIELRSLSNFKLLREKATKRE